MLKVEVSRGGLFIKTARRELWAERLEAGATPLNPNPTGGRWGLHRQAGELFVYAGPVAAVLSRRSVA